MCRRLARGRTDGEAQRGTEDRVLGRGNKPKEVLENKASDTSEQDLPPAGRSPLPDCETRLVFHDPSLPNMRQDGSVSASLLKRTTVTHSDTTGAVLGYRVHWLLLQQRSLHLHGA